MITEINHFSLLVNDEKEALRFYISVLGFEVVADRTENKKRILIIAPKGQRRTSLAILKADTEEKKALVGNQAGSSVLFTIRTDNFMESYEKLKKRGIEFVTEPEEKTGSTSAVFKDIYGNWIQMIGLKLP